MKSFPRIVFALLILLPAISRAAPPRPNIVILFADDMGYGDPSCYGNPLIRTPNIDRLAAEGMRLTSFVTASWCVPSRTELMTGRYMPRVKFNGSTGSDGKGGLPDSELTMAEGLKSAGYATHMIGKWHLGYKEKRFLPVNQGFDTWFGLPYSNDYMKPWVNTEEPLGLYRGEEMVEHPFDQDPLTTRYTDEAVSLINGSKDGSPFFLYLAYAMPHLPLAVSKERRGKSAAGLYGDVIEEVDWSVGEILDALEKKGISENTVVIFMSDNGPWTNMPPRMLQAGNEKWHAGSTGPLRGSKATSYEGGPRVPAIIRWPAKTKAGQVNPGLVGMPDIYRTMLSLGGAKLPEQKLDGHDLTAFLSGETDVSPRSEYYYFNGTLEAVRSGDWKLRTYTGKPELFNLTTDVSERLDRAEEMPGKVAELRALMEKMAQETGTRIAGG
jgi:arylsulfatase A